MSFRLFFCQLIWKEGRKEGKEEERVNLWNPSTCIKASCRISGAYFGYSVCIISILSKAIIVVLSSSVPPIVSLMLGSTLNPDDIKEGDDVYFECHVKANPPWRKLSWLHNVSSDFPVCKFWGLQDVIKWWSSGFFHLDDGGLSFLHNVLDAVRPQHTVMRDFIIVIL